LGELAAASRRSATSLFGISVPLDYGTLEKPRGRKTQMSTWRSDLQLPQCSCPISSVRLLQRPSSPAMSLPSASFFGSIDSARSNTSSDMVGKGTHRRVRMPDLVEIDPEHRQPGQAPVCNDLQALGDRVAEQGRNGKVGLQ